MPRAEARKPPQMSVRKELADGFAVARSSVGSCVQAPLSADRRVQYSPAVRALYASCLVGDAATVQRALYELRDPAMVLFHSRTEGHDDNLLVSTCLGNHLAAQNDDSRQCCVLEVLLKFSLETCAFSALKWIEATGRANYTPVVAAAVRGHAECLRTLIACGACLDAVDVKGNSGLDLALDFGHSEAVQVLTEAQAGRAPRLKRRKRRERAAPCNQPNPSQQKQLAAQCKRGRSACKVGTRTGADCTNAWPPNRDVHSTGEDFSWPGGDRMYCCLENDTLQKLSER